MFYAFCVGEACRLVPDWFPTINLGNSKEVSENTAKSAEKRWERAKQREIQRSVVESVASGTNSGVMMMSTAEATTQIELTCTKSCKDQVPEVKAEMSGRHQFEKMLWQLSPVS